ncbi:MULTISPECIES: DUF1499 domain-containing protein [Stappiaceae]|jgi:uncharacterized protein (DUF1499 family)|uniref:DUF1499 domain-containing protein n=1 Tax=Stappiaceae TaxID=2821832 RepID=UPI0003B8C0CD|nr:MULTISPECIES: DUF1499 domain-containing protein [Stappiaceae]ERP88421.1 hypothetical protein Q669_08175 [Labrenzia sp. C1B10]ERP99634.1 hypothetical protein Q675_13745 [Labrenzia sp. C1B70]MBO6858200.1 DUF1499 domain-containing protein [Roseibium sp.]MEE2866726.1 DUF1499 domain-containing protein [Pseudomonadota bacterium]
MKRYAVYKTASAPASRTTGSVALALAAIAFLAKRFGLIDADVFVLSLIAAATIALAAILLALFGFHRIWTYGGPGVPAALTGLFLGLLALATPVLVVGMLVMHAGASDLATNRTDPPELETNVASSEQPFLDWLNTALVEDVWPAVAAYTGAAPGMTAMANSAEDRLYPDIVPRRYRISTAQLHAASVKALEGLNWQVVDELPPDLLDAPTYLQAEGTSQILGLKHDIVLRVRPDSVGALLDVRSRSRTPLKDLTDNADRIRLVFSEIDRVLLETYGDLARLSVDETELEEDLPAEPVEDLRETIPLPSFKPYFEDEDAPVAEGLDAVDLEG